MFSGLAHVALIIWALLIIGPLILWMFLASFKTNDRDLRRRLAAPGPPALGQLGPGLDKAHVGRYILNSVLVVALSTAGTMLLGSMAAYVLARYKFLGNRFDLLPVRVGHGVPGVPGARAAVLRGQATSACSNTYTGPDPGLHRLLAAVHGLLPDRVLQDAADRGGRGGDGRRRLAHPLFFRIMLPMARPGLVSITIFNIIGQWNQYLLPLVLLAGAPRTSGCSPRASPNISTSAGYEADWSGLFAALTHRDPPDDRRVHRSSSARSRPVSPPAPSK